MSKSKKPLISAEEIRSITGCPMFAAEGLRNIIEIRRNTRAERTCTVEYPDDARMCSRCGYHVDRSSLFCKHCGAKVVE